MSPYSGHLAVLLYLLCAVASAWMWSKVYPLMPAMLKASEKAAMKKATDPKLPRGKVRAARRRAEDARDQWFTVTQLLDMMYLSGQHVRLYLLLGLAWPGLSIVSVAAVVRAVVLKLVDLVDGVRVECDACEKLGPWGWLLRSARAKAHRAGWVTQTAAREDLCPACAVAEGVKQ